MGISTTKVNKHGLSRTIPEPVKREVRQRSGFGCVICGDGIIQYEHVDPEYVDAKEHLSDAITLLCPSCHGRVTSGSWSKQKVKLAMKSPACLKSGFVKDVFDFCGGHPEVEFGGVLFSTTSVPLRIFSKPVLEIKAPEEDGGPFRISGWFYDEASKESLRIIDNEWQASSDHWDVETGGGRITIRDKPRNIVLRLSALPPDKIVIDRLKMNFGAVGVTVEGDELSFSFAGNKIGSFSGVGMSARGGIDLFPLNNDDSRINLITQKIRSVR